MTIYLISELYPVDEGDKSITHAIRHFADSWEEDVSVFRPLQLSFSQLGNFGAYFRLLKKSPRQVGEKKVIFFLLLKIPFIRKYLFWINRQHLKNPPDLIVGHSLMGNYLALSLSRRYGVPFSVGLHNYDIFNLVREKKSYEKVFQKSSLIACRSLNIESKLHELTENRFRHKTFVAVSGVEEQQIESQSFFEDKAGDWDKKERHYITAARLDFYKNIDINIEALAKVKEPFRYTIIGEGPERGRLQEKIDQLKLTEKIKILGWKSRSEVLEHFSKADVFLMISAPETFGLAYVEAMAKACLVVGARGWGIDGIIQHGKNGFLAEAKEKKSLENILLEIENLPAAKRLEILSEARKTVLELTRQKVADKYLNRLKEVIGE
jgi:glycosyltransferase involved in cell wall biosynthesis